MRWWGGGGGRCVIVSSGQAVAVSSTRETSVGGRLFMRQPDHKYCPTEVDPSSHVSGDNRVFTCTRLA